MRYTVWLALAACLLTTCGNTIQRYKIHDKLVKLEASYLAKWDKMKVVIKD